MSAEFMSEESKDFCPLYFSPGIKEGTDWHFPTGDQIITISDQSDQITDVLERSNGHQSLEEILKDFEQAGKDRHQAERVIRDLRRLGVIIDSREIAIESHGSTNNPQTFSRPLTSQDVLDITFND